MIERRAHIAELRSDSETRRLTGYAAVFNEDAPIGRFTERIAPGCFRASLAAGGDILCLVDHDPSALLGRTASGTLLVREDQRGLGFTVQLPKTQLAADVLELVTRRDIGGASIGFTVDKDEWPAADRRILRSVTLAEISIVRSWPAYSGTVVQARAHGLTLSALRSWRTAAARRRLIATL